MNFLATNPIVFILLTILYIVCSVFITKYIIGSGKSEAQIISDNKAKQKPLRLYENKYPEANVKLAKRYALAFGFIFAFASSIYAFSLMGKEDIAWEVGQIDVDSTEIIDIMQPISTEKPKLIKKVVPPPPPAPVVNVVTTEKETLPEIEEPQPKEVVVAPKRSVEIEPEPEVKEQKVFTIVEEMPRFKGCESVSKEEIEACTFAKIQQYVATVDYPQIAIDNDEEGKVFVSFVVDEEGNIVDVELINKLGNILDKTTLKHMKRMPKFAQGGKQRGRSVKVNYTVPVVFKLAH